MAKPGDADALLNGDSGEVKEANNEVRDATPLSNLLDKFPLTDQEKALWLILGQSDDTKIWRPEWEVFMGIKPTSEMLGNLMPGKYAILGFSEDAKEEVDSLRGYSFTTLPDGAEFFEIKTVVEMSSSTEESDYNGITDPEATVQVALVTTRKLPKETIAIFSSITPVPTALKFFSLTQKSWDEFSEEEKTTLKAFAGIFRKVDAAKETDQATLPTKEEPLGYAWDKIGFVDAGPNGLKLFSKDEDYPKPEDGTEFTSWSGGHIVFGPKGFAMISKSEKYPYPYPKPKDATAMLDSGETQRVLMVDSASFHINDDGFKVADGVMKVPATLVNPMVQVYKMGDKSVRVLKCPKQLKDALPFVDGRYVCDDHPLEQRVTQPRQIKGRLSDSKLNALGGIDTVLSITDATLQKKIENGKRDISIGFDCALLWKSGTFTDADGHIQEYDAIQQNILVDHAAVVEQGRCSIFDGCGLHMDDKTSSIVKNIASVDDLKGQVRSLEMLLKEPLADSIMSLSDKKTREELLTLPLTDLKELEAMVVDARPAGVPGNAIGGAQNLRAAIDAKFAEIGADIH